MIAVFHALSSIPWCIGIDDRSEKGVRIICASFVCTHRQERHPGSAAELGTSCREARTSVMVMLI